MTRLRIEYEARGASPRDVVLDAHRIALKALDSGSIDVEVGTIRPCLIATDGTGRTEVQRWHADCTATAGVEPTETPPQPTGRAERLAVAYDELTPVPAGWPLYTHPGVQAVARELLGVLDRDDFWTKTVISNPATALHAAVRAVYVLDRLPDA